MKKLFLLAIELVLMYPFGLLFSQNYVPFPEENVLWVVSEESPYPGWSHNCKYFIDGDTSINSLHYVKIYESTRDLVTGDTTTLLHASMRQNADEKLVYFIRHFWGDETEKLGYNFNVSVGNTVSLPAFYFSNIPGYNDSLFILLAITNILLENGEYRKQYQFKNNNSSYNYFIEGIGWTDYPIPNIGIFPHLSCFTYEDVFIYGYEEGCDFRIVDIEEIDNNNKSSLKISPNPSNGKMFIEILSEHVGLVDIEIFNNIGKSIFQLHNQDAQNPISVNTCSFTDGIYLVRISNKSTFIQSSKFIIKH